MLQRLVDSSICHPLRVLFVVAALIVAGAYSATRISIDALPDITGPQVQVNTEVAALAPEEIEALVTAPIEGAMAGLPKLKELRSLSKFGLSQVTMTFEEGVDIYLLRQWVNERLVQAQSTLPDGLAPTLAPVSTGLGEVVYYCISYKDVSLAPADEQERLSELRVINDLLVRPLLRSTPGLAEVNAIGGYERQIVISPIPEKLAATGISFSDVVGAIKASTENTGGGIMEIGGESVVVRADTRARALGDISSIPIKFAGAVEPILVKDIAEVSVGSALRVGTSTFNGSEAVTGAAIMLAGENSRAVARNVVSRLRQIESKLPPAIALQVVYDRSDLVHATIKTVAKNLLEGAGLVAAIIFLFLGHWRAALIVTLTIPLSFLFMLTGMAQGKISANLMSLGAIDFGLIVDGAIVFAENMLRHVAEKQREQGRSLSAAERLEAVRTASHEVVRPMFYGVLIITVVYIPILALGGIEGKMFRPMAIAVMLALGAGLAVALALVPALSPWLTRGAPPEREGFAVRACKRIYAPALRFSLRHRLVVVTLAVSLLVGTGWLFTKLGAEFIPELDEGSIALQLIRGNSVGLEASLTLQKETEKLLLERFPEISHIFSRIGTAEIATDPMGPNVADTYIMLRPREQWRVRDGLVLTKAQLVEDMRHVLTQTLPGQAYLFTQPIQLRFNEMMAGARANLSLKIFGHDFEELERLALQARETLRRLPGGSEIEFESLGRNPMLEITPKRTNLQRLALHADEINEVVGVALGGAEAGELVEGSRRIPVVVRLRDSLRSDLETVRQLPVISSATQAQIPLSTIAELKMVDRIGTVTRENNQRRVGILINVRGMDTESFVRRANELLQAQLKLPPGYFFEFGGQFENLQAARQRLSWIVPFALVLIFALLHACLESTRHAGLVFLCVPLAATGGVVSLWLRDMPFTLSAAVGFIALSGIAVLNGLMLISYINQLRRNGIHLYDAVTQGSLTRLRPKLMTALVASLGFVPMALATGPGAEVQRPLATVVIGGIITSTLLTLIVLPVLYTLFDKPSRFPSS
jgi:heavy metal efflux system protein